MELMVVVVIVGILSVLAVVGWKRIQWRVQVLGAADEFRNALLLARSDATTRQRNSGLYIDVGNLRYERFVDSSLTDGSANGTFDSGEVVLQGWQPLPAHMVFDSINSTVSPEPQPHPCTSAGTASPTRSDTGGMYSVVFRPDGRCWATFRTRFGISTFPDDTFTLTVLSPTGLVTLEH
jgi:type II secretory pathway pseudopilin PulG